MRAALIKALALGAGELGLTFADLWVGLASIEEKRSLRDEVVKKVLWELQCEVEKMKRELSSLTLTESQLQQEKIDRYHKAYQQLREMLL